MVVKGLEWTLWSFLVSLGGPGSSSLKTLGLLSSLLSLRTLKLEARSFQSVNLPCQPLLQEVADTEIIYSKYFQKESIFGTEIGGSPFILSNH